VHDVLVTTSLITELILSLCFNF